MRIRFTAAAVLIALVLGSAAWRVSAITFGFVDTTKAFANVGAFIVRSPTTGLIFPICSGTLIGPDAFLTASHCTAFFEQDLALRGFTAFVSFDSPIGFGDLTSRKTRLIPVVTVVTNPAFNQAQSDSGDIGLLLLDPSNTRGITAATLPDAGLLDDIVAAGAFDAAPVTNVGYGLQNRVVGGGVPFFQDANPIPRMFSFSTFNALNGGYIRYSQNAATGDGGACFGDSGGPQFFTFQGTTYLVSITITGDAVCRATNVSYRLDADGARSFLAPYVALP
jgi:Trypsin